MATFERTGPLKLEPQLDGSATRRRFDCGVAACVMALDDASYGLIRPSTEAVRKRMGNDRDATNPDQWKAAIDSYADRFTRTRPAATAGRASCAARATTSCWRLLARPASPGHRRPPLRHRGDRRSVRSGRSRSYRGNHAVYLRAGDGSSTETRKVPSTTHSPTAASRAARTVDVCGPDWLVQGATGNVRDGKGRRLYPAEDRWIGLVVGKARRIGEPDDGVDPGDPDGGTRTCPTPPSSSRSSPTPRASSRTTSRDSLPAWTRSVRTCPLRVHPRASRPTECDRDPGADTARERSRRSAGSGASAWCARSSPSASSA